MYTVYSIVCQINFNAELSEWREQNQQAVFAALKNWDPIKLSVKFFIFMQIVTYYIHTEKYSDKRDISAVFFQLKPF